jgi:hypothetical protein
LCRSDCRGPNAHERSISCTIPDPASTP